MKTVNLISLSFLTVISMACGAKAPQSSEVNAAESSSLARGESRACYKNVGAITPKVNPSWEVFITDESANGNYKLHAIRDNVELYGDNSRNVTLFYAGRLQDGRLLFQSNGRTVWLIYSSKWRGEFHSQYYGKDVVDMTCNENGLIPESALTSDQPKVQIPFRDTFGVPAK